MKTVLSLVFVLLLAFGAKAQPASYAGGDKITDSVNCVKYFPLWKQLFMEKNGMSEEYFDSHIHAYQKIIKRDFDGEWLIVSYNINIDWANLKAFDRLIIEINPNSNLWAELNVNKSEYLTWQEIEKAASADAFGARVTAVTPVEHFKYPSLEAAKQAALEKVQGMVTGTQPNGIVVSYHNFDRGYTPGHPYLNCAYYMDAKANKCMTQVLDLITGETTEHENPCVYPHYEK